ncbi:hypothetical protein THASP1DRAFT_29717 [Thamnocephalis sphaerospora]|uniref:Damage-control phosphatase ARMT1-like metal-binding domain-containing protein n=1 Tax=Thamnocephalis sphaerospora TaxID=78915 RepID=A0A4P9XRD1_9FUNG|nr:hypothetical protein THASP1DRAFT_29717 [Thamnocephalis sphaerospora]|eukprot:RKP08492.1 hypothetical protein THASP1DRAFT_29717 [Thamnocephalis sphaerospora]
MISNNIGQIAHLNAKNHGLTRIYFGGYFIRGHPVTMSTLSYAIKFWSGDTMKAFFLRHEGYLGAVGAFLMHQSNRMRASFSENFTVATTIADSSVNALGTLDSLPSGLAPLPKLADVRSYLPDTFSLANDADHQYWTAALERNLSNMGQLAIEWQPDDPVNARKRVARFNDVFRKHLDRLRNNPGVYGALTVRSLLDLRERCLHEFGFYDIFEPVKRREVAASLASLPALLARLDDISDESIRLRALIDGVLAGNMFDWGSNQTLELLRNGELAFETAGERITRPSAFYQADDFIARVLNGPAYQQAVMFVDNSGADAVLGVIPFVRYLLKQGTRVILAANTVPALNDITANELTAVIPRIAEIDDEIAQAWKAGHLTVIGTGSDSPCLDLRRLSEDLVVQCQSVDLVIIEGMGRAIHTNFYAKFTCDSLKIAVFKNKWAAATLGTDVYCGMCLFEQPPAAADALSP